MNCENIVKTIMRVLLNSSYMITLLTAINQLEGKRMSQKTIITRVRAHGHPCIGQVNGADCAMWSTVRPILRLIVVEASVLKRNQYNKYYTVAM